ncbi:MAG: DUF3365 domain-containing protein [Nitrospirae bacterium]|nr:DUF3365 domain-containing protein [Nitrospirota bacterium]
MKLDTTKQARNYIIILHIFLVTVTALSLGINLGQTRKQYEELAIVTGRTFFQSIIFVRRWNSEHGGVYAPITEKFKPNLYLTDPLRDLTATNGIKLTKINPAYMTRLISELSKQDQGVQFRVESLKPINPVNKADEWEKDAIKKFGNGISEAFDVVGDRESASFRYIAPLKTEQSCMPCHAKEGYKVGDIVGGISITFSYAPFQKAITMHKRQIYLVHAVFLSTGLMIIYFLGKKLVTRIGQLQESLLRIKKLEGLLPICYSCKKIRKEEADEWDQKSWIPLEKYITDRTDAEFTHGLCPICLKKLYPKFYSEYEKKDSELHKKS